MPLCLHVCYRDFIFPLVRNMSFIFCYNVSIEFTHMSTKSFKKEGNNSVCFHVHCKIMLFLYCTMLQKKWSTKKLVVCSLGRVKYIDYRLITNVAHWKVMGFYCIHLQLTGNDSLYRKWKIITLNIIMHCDLFFFQSTSIKYL